MTGTDETSLDALELTADERRLLAHEARWESEHYKDSRYVNPSDPAAVQAAARWRLIADRLHPDPWGRRP